MRICGRTRLQKVADFTGPWRSSCHEKIESGAEINAGSCGRLLLRVTNALQGAICLVEVIDQVEVDGWRDPAATVTVSQESQVKTA